MPSNEEQNDEPSLPDKNIPCGEEHEQKYNECAKNLETWVEELGKTNFSGFSLLSDDSRFVITN